MAHHYSDPARETDPIALPDVETFYHEHMKRERCMLNAGEMERRGGVCPTDDDEGDCRGTGWFYWFCFPGCLPDSDLIGPFDTEAAALADAREEN